MKQLTIVGSTAPVMEFHPLTNIIPDMTKKEFRGLVDDVRKNGLINPIRTYQGRIIDGRQRYKACLVAGVEPHYQEWEGVHNELDIFHFIISMNAIRQRFTEDQIAFIALDCLEYQKKAANKEGMA